MKLVEMVLDNGIIPILVFDGSDMPIKDKENGKREEFDLCGMVRNRERMKKRQEAQQLELEGKIKEANSSYAASINITPELYVPLIKRLIERGVSYIIAPYEADAELAYLSHHHLVDLIITQDGDSLAYGCEKVLFKLSPKGRGEEIQYRNVFQSTELSIREYSEDMFLYLCILSKCDFLPNPRGKGIKRLVPFVKEGRTPDRILQLLQLKGGCDITDQSMLGGEVTCRYRSDFHRAINTFRYQIVFDPVSQMQTTLTPVPEDFDLSLHTYFGTIEQDVERARELSRLHVNPLTGERIDCLAFPESYDNLGFISLKKDVSTHNKLNLLHMFPVRTITKSTIPKPQKMERPSVEKEKTGLRSPYFKSSKPRSPVKSLSDYKYEQFDVC